MAFLSRYTVRNLDLPVPLVCLRHPVDGLYKAIEVLAERALLSAPVLSEDGKVLGVLDALDVVAYVVDRAAGAGAPDPEAPLVADEPLDKVMGRGHATSAGPGAARHAHVGLDEPLDKVAALLSTTVRRAVVLGPEGEAHSVVTQSQLLKFLHDHIEELGQARAKAAKEFCSDGAVSVSEESSALSAFQVMRTGHVSSIGIVDDAGCLVSVASATDLVKSLARMSDKASALQELERTSVLEFVAWNRQHDIREIAAAVTARPDQHLDSVLSKLAACRVHRVMVCEERRPVGVLSLTDVCRAVSAA